MNKPSLKNTLKNIESKKISIRELNQDYINKIKEKMNLNIFIHFDEQNILEQVEKLEKDKSNKQLNL